MVSFGSSSSKQQSQSESKPEVWEGIEPYLRGTGDISGSNAGPTGRFAPQQLTPEYQDWNQKVAEGLFLGPPPEMSSYGDSGAGVIGNEGYNPGNSYYNARDAVGAAPAPTPAPTPQQEQLVEAQTGYYDRGGLAAPPPNTLPYTPPNIVNTGLVPMQHNPAVNDRWSTTRFGTPGQPQYSNRTYQTATAQPRRNSSPIGSSSRWSASRF